MSAFVWHEMEPLLICHGCRHLIKDFGDMSRAWLAESQRQPPQIPPRHVPWGRKKLNIPQYLRIPWFKIQKKQPLLNMPFQEDKLQHFIRDQVSSVTFFSKALLLLLPRGTGSSKPCTCSSPTSSPSLPRSFLHICLDREIQSKLPEAILPEMKGKRDDETELEGSRHWRDSFPSLPQLFRVAKILLQEDLRMIIPAARVSDCTKVFWYC